MRASPLGRCGRNNSLRSGCTTSGRLDYLLLARLDARQLAVGAALVPLARQLVAEGGEALVVGGAALGAQTRQELLALRRHARQPRAGRHVARARLCTHTHTHTTLNTARTPYE